MLDEVIRTRKELAVATVVRPWRFDAEDFAQLRSEGILPPDVRFELVDGQVYPMSPIGHAHAGIVALLTRHATLALGEAVLVWPQNPVRMSDDTVLQPDIALLRPPIDAYRDRPVRPEDVLLVIEVADSSLAYDRQIKGPRYAAAGIPEYWLVAVGDRRIEAYREPTAQGYRASEVLGPGRPIHPVALPALSVDVAEILGEPRGADEGDRGADEGAGGGAG
jgi:Uma2 family endonuclease